MLAARAPATITVDAIPGVDPRRIHAARAANQRYSLRAFARFLGMDHSTLSQLMRGRRRLTARAIGRLGRRLAVAEAAGAKIIVPKSALPDGDTMAVLLDPHGMSFAVVARGSR